MGVTRRGLLVLRHAQERLGEAELVWDVDGDGRPMPFDVACLATPEDPGVRSYVTLGLSEHDLGAGGDGARVRNQELLLLAAEPVPIGAPPEVLRAVGALMLESHLSVWPGVVLGPTEPMLEGTGMTAVFVTTPGYWDDDFGLCHDDGIDVLVVQLIPVTTAEARFARSEGLEAFEQLLVEQDPDVTDWFRPELTLPERVPPAV